MKVLGIAVALALAATSANAAQIILNEQSVVGSTGSLNWAGHSYGAGNIFDNQTGNVPIERNGDGSYWLNPDQPGDSWITIDLGQESAGLQFDLFNSHNGEHWNRGTGAFEILASNELLAAGDNGFTLGGAITRLTGGPLDAVPNAGLNFIPGQRFVAEDLGAYRYIQFRALSPIAGSFTPYAYGLDEMRVFSETASAVPEPTTWAMMIVGFGLAGAALRTRRWKPAI